MFSIKPITNFLTDHFEPADNGGVGDLDRVMSGAAAANQRGMNALGDSLSLAHVEPFRFGPRVGER